MSVARKPFNPSKTATRIAPTRAVFDRANFCRETSASLRRWCVMLARREMALGRRRQFPREEAVRSRSRGWPRDPDRPRDFATLRGRFQDHKARPSQRRRKGKAGNAPYGSCVPAVRDQGLDCPFEGAANRPTMKSRPPSRSDCVNPLLVPVMMRTGTPGLPIDGRARLSSTSRNLGNAFVQRRRAGRRITQKRLACRGQADPRPAALHQARA